MNWLPTRFAIFGLTLSTAIFVAWIFAKPAALSPQVVSNDDQRSSVSTTELPSVQAPKPIENSDGNFEKTRIEQFSDVKRIGRRGKNKIEIECFSRGDGRFAEIKFYTRSDYGSWLEVQSFKYDKDGLTDCDPVIEDFNNDGLKDFTYQSDVAARGANEIRKLFIYDIKRDQLVYIQNSDDYPNLAYNKKLNCIDSFIVTGTTETVFLRLEDDKLREFASVSNGLEREVRVTNKAGESRIVRREKYNIDDFEEAYRRFSTYNPPQ